MQPDAWARMVDVFSPIVYRWARVAGLSGSDAADVVQDVFVSIARNVSGFQRQKDKASFRSWLATITRNRIKDFYRSRKKYPAGLGGTEAYEKIQKVPQPASVIPSDSDLEKSISLADLDQRLPIRVLELVKAESAANTWQAFWLTTVMGDAAADVANRLGIGLASVYQAKSRILRRLRQKMDELP